MSVQTYIGQKLDGVSSSAKRVSRDDVVFLLLTAIPLFFIIGVPVIYFVWSSVWTTQPGFGGQFTLEGYVTTFTSSVVHGTFLNTLIIAVGTTVLSLVFGIIFMVYSMKTNGIGRRIIPPILIVQYLLPSFLAAISWQFYAGPQAGVLNQVVALLPFVESGPFDVFSLSGIIVVAAAHYSGLVYLLTSGGMKAIPANLEEIGWIGGAQLPDIMRTISLPLVLPGLAISAVLIFTRMVQSFGIPLILGLPDQIFVVSTLIFRQLETAEPNFTFVSALGVVLLSVTLWGLVLQRRVSGSREKYETVTGSGSVESMRFDLGRWRLPVSAVVLGIVFLVFVMPFVILVIVSFQNIIFGFQFEKVTWTVDHYATLFVGSWSDGFYNSVWNTILVALGAGLGGMVLSTMTSYLIVKSDSPRISALMDYVSISPSGIPGIIYAVALLLIVLTFPLGLYGSIWILVIAFAGRFIIYGTRAVNSSFRSIGQELEDAAHVSGAGKAGIFRRIFGPLIRPGFTAGLLIYVIDTTKSLTLPILLGTGDNEMIQLFLFRLLGAGEGGMVAATAVLMTLAIFGLYGFIHVFTDIDVTSL